MDEGYIRIVKKQIEKKLQYSMLPIAIPDSDREDQRLKLHGSSLYFSYNNKYYISTAYHVLFEDQDFIKRIFFGEMYYNPNEMKEKIPLESIIYFNKKDDVAFLALKEKLESPYVPYDLNKDLMNNIDVKSFYCIGFPASKTNHNGEEISKMELISYGSQEKKRKTPNRIEIPFDKIQNSESNINKKFCPKGMSGGVYCEASSLFQNVKIKGILSEYTKDSLIAINFNASYKKFIQSFI